ncbi:MAG: hypothetical protein M1289_02110 [Patescibacteria group bacterium]|nr:hypothetical protein [Patescibacteria group bacterium]
MANQESMSQAPEPTRKGDSGLKTLPQLTWSELDNITGRNYSSKIDHFFQQPHSVDELEAELKYRLGVTEKFRNFADEEKLENSVFGEIKANHNYLNKRGLTPLRLARSMAYAFLLGRHKEDIVKALGQFDLAEIDGQDFFIEGQTTRLNQVDPFNTDDPLHTKVIADLSVCTSIVSPRTGAMALIGPDDPFSIARRVYSPNAPVQAYADVLYEGGFSDSDPVVQAARGAKKVTIEDIDQLARLVNLFSLPGRDAQTFPDINYTEAFFFVKQPQSRGVYSAVPLHSNP